MNEYFNIKKYKYFIMCFHYYFCFFLNLYSVVFSVSSMITVPVNTSLYQTVVQQISDGSIQV